MVLIRMGKSRPRSRPANGIIVKNYEHHNRAFSGWDSPQGKYISTKAEYQRELDRQGMITCEEAEKRGLNSGAKRHEYKITEDTQQLIENVRMTADANGKIKPGDKAVEALNAKINKKYCEDAVPKDAPTEGGFGE
jgi:hypothetical protein